MAERSIKSDKAGRAKKGRRIKCGVTYCLEVGRAQALGRTSDVLC